MIAIRDSKSLAAGALFTVFGLGFSYLSSRFHLGSLTQMGPGYLPLMLGLALTFLGLVISFGAFRGPLQTSGEPFGWLTLAIILGSIIVFGLIIRKAGFIPAVFVLVMSCNLAGDGYRFKSTLILALALSLFSYLIFVRGLGLNAPAFGSWFGG